MKFLLLAIGLAIGLPTVRALCIEGEARPAPTSAGDPLSPLPALRTPAERFGDPGVAASEIPSFRRHVIPLASRVGCNARECHGAFSGQGGFVLSLFGYDFENDHREMTQDKGGGEGMLRIDAQHPEQSLLLLKATRQISHKGKQRFAKDGWEYHLMLKWIKAGATMDVTETGEFDRLEVFPKEIAFQKPGDRAQLKVLAYWKDGTVEDVTQLTRFRSNDDTVASVSAAGEVQGAESGDTHVVAFYDNGVHPIPVMLPASELAGDKYPKVVAPTRVDELVLAKLRKRGIVPSEPCTDAEFLRRVKLDLAGTLPTPAEVRAFLADKSPDKRAAKIEELLKSPGYAAWWTTKLNDFAGNSPRRLSAPTGDTNFFSHLLSRQWYEWVYRRVETNEPYDQMVAGMVLATGRLSPDQSYEEFATEMASYFRSKNPADFAARPTMPFFWQRNNIRKPEEKALAFAHTFLGVRIECAECHKHPFDQWTKTDFRQFQAFFEPIQYAGKPNTGQGPDYRSTLNVFKERLGPTRSMGTKIRAEEFKKQIDEGVLLPWPEVFVADNARRTAREMAKRKKLDPNYSGRVFTPKILGGEEVLLNGFADPRQPLMEWLRSRENPYFARALVNRVWANYFGQGIVEPADDMNLANPPSNKELMDYLADGFVASGYDMKWLHRQIVNSDAYQRSWRANETNRLDERNFSRMVLRRLPAEVAMDAVAQATASTERLEKFGADIQRRAIGPLAGGSDGGGGKGAEYALTVFGKPLRDMNCDCERVAEPSLLQTIFTRNDPVLLSFIEGRGKDNMAWITELRGASRMSKPRPGKADADRRGEPRVRPSTGEGEHKVRPYPTDQIIEELFLRTVSRLPTAEEVMKAKEDIAAAKDPVDGIRDLLWAMLNTREFMVNH